MVGDTSDTIKGIKGLQEKTLVNLFPEIKERVVSLDEIIKMAIGKQEERISSKKKPIKVLENIINSTTDGVQKNKIYEINEKLVNLKKPLMTDNAVKELNELTNTSLNDNNRDLKNVMRMMERDGLDRIIGEHRYPEYLLPFKKLITRE